jgi:predicted ArsR family transcriptional regulator
VPWWQQKFGKSTRGRVVALLRRGARSVEDLAAALGLTDNAVRAQLATLEKDGVISAAGIRRDGSVGKPATLYDIDPAAHTLFSAAYAPTLAALVTELGKRMKPAELEAILRDVGKRLAPESTKATTPEGRVRAAAALLAELGGDADLVKTADGVTIRAYGCPLAQAVSARPETCRAVEQLLSEVSGAKVREHCDRSHALPHCRFDITAPRRTPS